MIKINQIENEDKLLEFVYTNNVDEFQKCVNEIITSNNLSDYNEEDLLKRTGGIGV